MLRIYTCLTQHHNPWLVVLAGFICFLCALTAFNVISRARHAQAIRMRHLWLVTAAFVIGFGIWATHFVAMLAFDPGLPIAYDLDLTLVSVALAILITGAGIAAYVWWPNRLGALTGGVTVGLGITCMHYTGMAAVRLSGYITYDLDLVATSILLGTVLAALAFFAKNHVGGAKGALAGTGLLTLAICGMHFTAMAAASLVPMNTGPLPASSLSNGWLATAISAAALTVTILCLATSLLDQHLARRAVDESVRLRTLAEAGTEGIVICSDGVIVHSNSNFTRFTGLSSVALTGRSITDFIGHDAYERALANMEQDTGAPFEANLAAGQDIQTPVEIVARRMVTGKEARQVFALRDLTEQKRSQARIEHLAHHDTLTALSNRPHLESQMVHDIALAIRMDARLAVLHLNLDRFKTVNDALGHQAGDLLLQGVAQRLTDIVRDTDTVARLGNDEFAILQVGISQPDGATHLAKRVLRALEKPFLLDGTETAVGISMGIAIFPEDGATPMALLRNADIALSRAKTEGRNGFRFYKPGMDEAMLLRHTLECDLKRSVRNGEMFLEYQPQADATTGRITGFEALVRWQHPRRGRLGPEAFIEVAEECGYIVEIGTWVLEQACRDAAAWEQPLNIAVNLSPLQFQRTDLVASVGRVLKETGLAPERLELEITEGVLLADREGATQTLSKLKELGARIAMDDFGTGYSSLSYLQSFPFDKIKVDRSFVADLEDNGDARAIVNAVIGLSQSLNLPVIAEGVERPSQLDFLRRAGCNEVQGYLIGKPAAIDSFVELTGPRLKIANNA